MALSTTKQRIIRLWRRGSEDDEVVEVFEVSCARMEGRGRRGGKRWEADVRWELTLYSFRWTLELALE